MIRATYIIDWDDLPRLEEAIRNGEVIHPEFPWTVNRYVRRVTGSIRGIVIEVYFEEKTRATQS